MSNRWRDKAKQVIQRVLSENKDASLKEKKKLLREAYPFGQRKYHPYKIWCDEVKVQLNLKRKKVKIPVNQLDLL